MARTARTIEVRISVPDGPAPLRHRLGDALVEQIRTGRLRPGDALPASRALAKQLSVSRTAVVDAYDQLLAAGFVTATRGSGTFVASGADRAALAGAVPQVADPARPRVRRRPARGPEPVGPRWSLRPSSPDTSLLDQGDWRRAWRSAARLPLGAVFPTPGAHHELQAALSDHLRRTRGIVAAPEEILLVPGIAAALRPLAHAAGLVGRTVAVEDPGYCDLHGALAAVGSRVRPVPVDADGLDPGLLQRGDCAVYVTPAHQFPLGGRMPVERRCDLLAWARRTGGLLLEDDYDGEYRYDVSPLPAMRSMVDARDHVVYLGTTSKILSPALRVAWVVAPARLAPALARELVAHGLAVDAVAASAVAELIRTGALSRHLARASRHYATRREALTTAISRHLPGLATVGVDAGLHVVLLLPDGTDDTAVAGRALREGVQVEPLSGYAIQDARSGLVLGYARLPPTQADEVVRILARAVRAQRAEATRSTTAEATSAGLVSGSQ